MGGEVEFLTEKKFPLRNVPGLKTQKKKKKKLFSLLNLKKKVPGVLKRMQKKIVFEGGRFWGVWGAPHPHPGVARVGIHFFLWSRGVGKRYTYSYDHDM